MKAPFQLFIALAVLLATATVAAQVYKWVDKDGKVQYSDSPPPPSATKSEAKKIDTGPAVSSTAPPAAKSLQDRAKDSDKRRNDIADAAKKTEEAAKVDAQNAEACKSAQVALKDMEGGRPIRRSNADGEVAIMTDEERQAETAKIKAVVAAACKA